MTDISHGREITTTSYYEGAIASSKREVEISILTTRERMIKDVIDCLAVFSNNETNDLDLAIKRDSKERYRIVKRWQAND